MGALHIVTHVHTKYLNETYPKYSECHFNALDYGKIIIF